MPVTFQKLVLALVDRTTVETTEIPVSHADVHKTDNNNSEKINSV